MSRLPPVALAVAAVALAAVGTTPRAAGPCPVAPGEPPLRAVSTAAKLTAITAPEAPPGGSVCEPGEILDLRGWKLTLPTGADGSPKESLPADLRAAASQYFGATRGCDGVAFRAPVTGVTTKGSSYPRSELREMDDSGSPAAWSATSGTHSIAAVEAFTALPKDKPELVGLQIHDDNDDVSVFRLEGTKLYVTKGDDPHYRLIDAHYQLGTVFAAAFLVTGGVVWAYYNGRAVAAIPGSFSGAYFKAGAYTQANCSNSPCSASNYGETVIYGLRVGHG